MINIKRAYDNPAPEDGVRILVDRMWPRGVRKDTVAIDLWLKEIAPGNELRTWFGHDPAKWDEFRCRYAAELDRNPEPVRLLRERIRAGDVTLVYAAKDERHNNAVVLKEYLEGG